MKCYKHLYRYSTGTTLMLFSRYVFCERRKKMAISQSVFLAGTPLRPLESLYREGIMRRRKLHIRQWKGFYRINSMRNVAVGMGVEE